ncbi:hypothetical protein D9758_010328 [Tetrapyrgos nigripes]|uniref:R3H domain-containing protein n=1 Tax=Tetrapyrgos nigripes TaxID=182062 RepID=A0A8H5FVS0_9AGAR|nr:hypothetical protein D9758_010328 [Tetrapyrgos nigripes]
MDAQATGQPAPTPETPQSTRRPPQRPRQANRPQPNSTDPNAPPHAPSNNNQRKRPPRKPQNNAQVNPPRAQDEKGEKGSKGRGGKGRFPSRREKEMDGKDKDKTDGEKDKASQGTPGRNTPNNVEGPSQARAAPTPGARNRRARFNASLTSETPQAGPSHSKYKQRPGLPDPSQDDLTSNLIRGLTNQPYADCPICFNAIHPPQPIWCCSPLIPVISDDDKTDHEPQYCWTPFHLKCIRSWSDTSYKDVKAAWAARGEPERSGEWRCPGCQGRRNRLIRGYFCFCGSVPSPNNRLATPHSCGNPCSRQRTSCHHPCPLLCHPGPCPPCKVTMDIPCNCIRKRVVAVRCGDDANISCNEPCSKILSCGKHHCTKTCHIGECDPCPKMEKQKCWCEKEEKEVKCGEGDVWLGGVGCDTDPTSTETKETMVEPRKGFRCTDICGKPYDCGEHVCDKPCHPPSSNSINERGHCPLSPDRITTCPCGKRRIAPSSSTTSISTSTSSSTTSTSTSPQTQNEEAFPPRAKCTDPIPTCPSPCLKPQVYCDHPCQTKCHSGPCPPCSVDIVRPCRCGSTTQVIKCGVLHRSQINVGIESDSTSEPNPSKVTDEVLCEKPCLALRSCGRHQCNRVCCPLASLAGQMTKKGKKKIVTVGLTEEDIGGLHDCDLICGKMLGCGNHTCEEKDHKGPCKPCLRSSFEELICFCGRTVLEPPIPCGTKVKCPYPCVFPPPPCGHPKTPHSCHADDAPCPPCYSLTTKKCACGKKDVPNVRCSLETEKVGCSLDVDSIAAIEYVMQMIVGLVRRCVESHASYVSPTNTPAPTSATLPLAAPKTNPVNLSSHSPVLVDVSVNQSYAQEPKCTTECAVAKRNRKLAEALGINTVQSGHNSNGSDNAGGGGGRGGLGDVVYHDELVAFGRGNGKFLGVVEKAFADFVTSSKKSQVLPHMPPDRRKFVHDLANVYRMDTQMVDQEPKRSVQIIRRIDTRIPTPTLSAYLINLGLGPSHAPTSSLGKLADLRGGSTIHSPSPTVAASSTSAWRSGSPATVTSSSSSTIPNRGWTSVVGAGAGRPSGLSSTGTGTGGGGSVSPWNISRAASPSPQTSTQTRGINAAAATSVPHPNRTPEAAVPAPAPSGSDEPVPDNWEDEA